MSYRSAEVQAKIYLYDIRNCALENGFKPDNKWQVKLVNDSDKKVIANTYHPTISVKIAQASLVEVFMLVKEKLGQETSDIEQEYTNETIRLNDIHHLIAYSEKKLRRH